LSKAELGTKRECTSCSVKFYDFDKNPSTCPKCGTEFIPEPLPRRRAKPVPAPVPKPAPAPAAAEDDDTEVASENENVVPLDEIDESATDTVDGDNKEEELLESGEAATLDADEEEEDTFVSDDEDEDDDVSNLVPNSGKTDEV